MLLLAGPLVRRGGGGTGLSWLSTSQGHTTDWKLNLAAHACVGGCECCELICELLGQSIYA